MQNVGDKRQNDGGIYKYRNKLFSFRHISRFGAGPSAIMLS